MYRMGRWVADPHVPLFSLNDAVDRSEFERHLRMRSRRANTTKQYAHSLCQFSGLVSMDVTDSISIVGTSASLYQSGIVHRPVQLPILSSKFVLTQNIVTVVTSLIKCALVVCRRLRHAEAERRTRFCPRMCWSLFVEHVAQKGK